MKTDFTRGQDQIEYRLTFAGFLAVRLMEFDYCGKHYSYHGKKLENAVKRLTTLVGGAPVKASTPELVIWGQAAHDWKEFDARAEADRAGRERCNS